MKCLDQSQACNSHYRTMDTCHYHYQHHCSKQGAGHGERPFTFKCRGCCWATKVKTGVDNSSRIQHLSTHLPLLWKLSPVSLCWAPYVNCARGAIFHEVQGEAKTAGLQKDDAADPQNKLWRGRWGRGKKERAKGVKEVGEEKRTKGQVDPKRKKSFLLWFPTTLQCH